MIPVVHLITTLDVGGAETALVALASRLDRRRFASTVVALRGPGTLIPPLRRAGIEALTLSDTRVIGPGALGRLASVIRRVRPAVLQTWLYHADLLGLVVGRVLRVPCIGWNLRCAELDRRDHPASLFWMQRLLVRLSSVPDFVVVNSMAGQTAHERLGYRPRQWEFIPNGIDTDVFAPSSEARDAVRRELDIAADAPVVGLVARYHPMKDHGTFIAACGRVRRRYPDLRVVMTGRGVEEGNRQLCAALEAHGLAGQTRLLGETARPNRVLAALDVAVSSSYGEAFPNVVAEAMAAAVPVVATDVGDSARIVGDRGTLVPARDPHALAEAVERTLALPPADRLARGRAGRERILEEFSLAAMVSRYERLYEQLGRRPVRSSC